MRSFNYSIIREQKWDSEILSLIAAIYKEAGKQELFVKQRPEELNKLVEIAKIQSTEASNAIEGIVTTSTRIRELVNEKTTPRNRDEQEIAGYRDVLNIIHENFDVIPISKNYILQLHKILYGHMNNPLAGRTKSVQNYISATYPDGSTKILFTPLAPYETPEALERICEEYNKVIGNLELEPLIAIPVFIHDFLCIHPFNDGNGRMSRLLTTLLLYRSGFYVGKYISLEAKVAQNKDLYYEALADSQIGWHEGKEDAIPFVKYILGTILAAYKDFEERMTIIEPKLSALEMVRRASENKIGRFNKQDIRDAVSIGEIPQILNHGYCYLLYDFGVLTETNYNEFLRCDRKIVIGSLAPWKEQLYHKFIQSTFIGQKSWEDFYYLVLFGEGNDMQAFRKKYHLSMAQIPFFKNPFHIEKEQFPFLQELL